MYENEIKLLATSLPRILILEDGGVQDTRSGSVRKIDNTRTNLVITRLECGGELKVTKAVNTKYVKYTVADRLDLQSRVNSGETIPSSASTAGYSALNFGEAETEAEMSCLKPAR